MVFRLSGGLYQQPPLYRELRDSIGAVIPDVKAQKSKSGVFMKEFSYTICCNILSINFHRLRMMIFIFPKSYPLLCQNFTLFLR